MKIAWMILLLALLTGCVADDPLGTTTRAQIAADAKVAQAQVQAFAEMQIASTQANGKIAVVNAIGGLVVPALLIVGVIIAMVMVLYFRGRIALLRTELQMPPVRTAIAQSSFEQRLHLQVEENGWQLQRDNVGYIVIKDGRKFRPVERKQLVKG